MQQGKKWRLLPRCILPEDLWDVNLATCTIVEEKHDVQPKPVLVRDRDLRRL